MTKLYQFVPAALAMTVFAAVGSEKKRSFDLAAPACDDELTFAQTLPGFVGAPDLALLLRHRLPTHTQDAARAQ